ncbi:MAG: diaminopropionate ammonia-lyase [Solirubrobacteraceae bacterium]|jgi:diaminopropionate ammonia-lyase|nr:diaminopropionate ammonia-lyase [Solirubrobacteraceae bacterium]
MSVDIERHDAGRAWRARFPPPRAPQEFHRGLSGYEATPLRAAGGLAEEFGLGALWLKDETVRLTLPAFKIMGASWAVAQALRRHLGLQSVGTIDELRAALAQASRPTLVAATDGNHGRAVARMARLLDLPARIFVPEDMVPARRTAIASEGAEVLVVDGGYDAAVARSAREPGVVVSDTSWPGYDETPRDVIDGYSTVLWEVEDELRRRGAPDPDVVLVPVGVGAFAAAVVAHYRRPGLPRAPSIIAVEPARAACLLASARAGELVTIPGLQDSIMSGLNCGTPSAVAWPSVSGGIDRFVAIDDDAARLGMRALAAEGIVGGECAGATVGAMHALRSAGMAEDTGLVLGASVLTFLTEGATDPAGYERIVGRRSEDVAAGAAD